MKRRLASIIGLYALLALLSAPTVMTAAAEEVYTVDTDHTYIWFRIKHLGIGYSYGRFSNPTGRFTFDDATASNGSIDIQVDAAGVDTDVQKRDNHLKSPDFLNVEKYPVISFKSTSFKKVAENTYSVTGEITLLGQTRPIEIKALQTGAGKDPWGKHRRAFETKFTIKRSEFGMDFLMSVAGDEVELTVSVEGIKQ